jgi:hypothetical protein
MRLEPEVSTALPFSVPFSEAQRTRPATINAIKTSCMDNNAQKRRSFFLVTFETRTWFVERDPGPHTNSRITYQRKTL